jgi:hypothetical protein
MWTGLLQAALRSSLVILVVALVVLSGFYLRWGSIGDGMAWLGGTQLIVGPQEIDLGDVQCGATQELSVRVRNLGGGPVDLIGASTSCGCLTPSGVPTTVAGLGECEVTSRLTVPRKEGSFEHTLTIYSELDSQTLLPIKIEGNAVDERKE